ncbi:MAG TPA: IS1 family transposase [Gemmatimonadales bacterium]
MYRLSRESRSRIIHALCEGNGVRATGRLTGAAKGTILRLLAEVGTACATFHHDTIRRIRARRVQCDEIWSFVSAKERRVGPEDRGNGTKGDIWTWVALDQDSKLCISWLVGNRSPAAAAQFIADLRSRLASRVQLSTDGLKGYPPAVEAAFGWNGADYAQLVKTYGQAPTDDQRRYSPPLCTGAQKQWIMGRPAFEDVCTSHVERSNLSMRMQMRRFTRLTNGFSKKAENHVHAVALYFAFYNFCRPHQTLTKRARGIHRTPAIAAGLTSRVWTVSDLLMLLPSERYRAGVA